MATFTPPTTEYGNDFPGAPLWVWYTHITRGLTVLKTAGVYTTVDFPRQEDCDGADICYLGGHIYTVDDTEAAALTAAGYGAYIT